MLRFLSTFFICLFLIGLTCACSMNGMLREHYVVACPTQWTSMPLFGQDKQVGGYLVDLMQAISKEEGVDIQVVMVPESEIPALVERKNIAGYFSAMPKAFRSERQYDLSSSLFASGFLLVVKNDSSKKNLDECVNMNIGYTAAASYYLQSVTHPSWREYLYDTVYAALDDLMRGRIEGVILDSLNMKILSQGFYAGSFRPLLPPIFMREIRLVSPKNLDKKACIDVVEKGLHDLAPQQVSRQLLEYWELFSLTVP